MKKKIIWFLKACLAILISFGIISGFCCFYYNLPVHFTNHSKATDYYWEQNSFSIRCTEGFAKVGTDNNGFVNTYSPKSEVIDVLIMGSSHTEGFNVGEKENYTYLLNEKFANFTEDLYFYSIGTSAHFFPRCLRNLEQALMEFNPQKYVVIETANLSFSLEDLDKVQNGTLEYLPSYNSGLVYNLQKSNFFRLLYTQLSNVLKNEKLPWHNDKDSKDSTDSTNEPGLLEYEANFDEVLKSSSEISKNQGCKLIIVNIPQIEIDYNGDVLERKDLNKYRAFEKVCAKYDIGFVDLYDGFVKEYNEKKVLPQGFANTGVGVGHINKYGHAAVADELFAYIMEDGEQ